MIKSSELQGEIVDSRFQLVEEIAKGGYGTVYKAIEKPSGRVVAFKVLKRDMLSEETVRRFEREAKAIRAIDHPNVARLYGYGFINDGRAYMATEYVEGNTLSDEIKQKGSLTAEEILPVLIELSKALKAVHAADIVHRDIKPANVMLCRDEAGKQCIKLIDFGLTKPSGEWAKNTKCLTEKGFVVGSVRYMSPEQCMDRDIDCRTDIYGFGCTGYEAVTGTPPFDKKGILECMRAHVQEVPIDPAIQTKDQMLKWKLHNIILKCLEKNPDHRYQTAEDLLLDLTGVTSTWVGYVQSAPAPAKSPSLFAPVEEKQQEPVLQPQASGKMTKFVFLAAVIVFALGCICVALACL